MLSATEERARCAEWVAEMLAVCEKIADTRCSHGNPALGRCGPCIAGGYLPTLRARLTALRIDTPTERG